MRVNVIARLFATVIAAISVAGPVVAGAVVHGRFESAALGVNKSYLIYLPTSYAAQSTRRYPVLFLLHGWGGNQADWLARGNIDRVADAVFGSDTPEMILVMPDGDNGWYVNWERSTNWEACRSDPRNAPEEFCARQGRYADYISEDLVKHVDGTYRTLAGRGHRAVAGFSMGGFGALHLGLSHPEVFGAVASIAGTGSLLYAGPRPFKPPAQYMTDLQSYARQYSGWEENEGYAFGLDAATWWKRDPGKLAAQLRQAGAGAPAVYLTIGTDDKRSIDANRALAYELGQLGIAHELHEIPGGIHTWGFVASREAHVLRWLAAQIAVTDTIRKTDR